MTMEENPYQSPKADLSDSPQAPDEGVIHQDEKWEIHSPVTANDFVAIYACKNWYSPAPNSHFWLHGAFPTIVVLFLAGLMYWFDWPRLFLVEWLWLLTLSLTPLVTYRGRHVNKTHRKFRRLQRVSELPEKYRWGFSSNEFLHSADHEKTKHQWTEVDHVWVRFVAIQEQHVLLFNGSRGITAVPRRVFRDEEQFQAFLKDIKRWREEASRTIDDQDADRINPTD
ncbi:MAG: hypothetical protein N2C14_12735 [Planctomycetales bacterium]